MSHVLTVELVHRDCWVLVRQAAMLWLAGSAEMQHLLPPVPASDAAAPSSDDSGRPTAGVGRFSIPPASSSAHAAAIPAANARHDTGTPAARRNAPRRPRFGAVAAADPAAVAALLSSQRRGGLPAAAAVMSLAAARMAVADAGAKDLGRPAGRRVSARWYAGCGGGALCSVALTLPPRRR